MLICCSTIEKRTVSSMNNVAKPPVKSVFPNFTTYLSTNPLPTKTIYNIPNQIKLLKPDSELTLREFLSKLGLKNYKNNLSANIRFNHYFVYVDEEKVLYIEVDVTKLDSNLDWFKPDLNVPVISCKLRKNPDITLAKWSKQKM